MTSVAVIGASLYGNRGAEAMLSVCIAKVREKYPSARIHVFSYYPADDRRLLRGDGIEVHSATPLALVAWLIPMAFLYRFLAMFSRPLASRCAAPSVLALADSKAMLCVAGVSFVDGREKFLAFNVAMLLPALLLGTPVIKISQALGSFDHWLNRAAAKLLLPRCMKIYARGESTRAHLKQLFGEDQFVGRSDDAAFLFDPALSVSAGIGSHLNAQFAKADVIRSGATATVGLCPSSVVMARTQKAGSDYVGLMVDTVEQLVSHGCAVFLFPNATRDRHGDALHNNDLPLITMIVERLSPGARSRTAAFQGALNAADICKVIERCHVVGTSRFHAMVMGLRLGKPVAVIGWSHKYLEVMTLFGQEDMVVDYRGDTKSIAQKLFSLSATAEDRSSIIRASLPAVIACSQKQFDEVNAYLAT